MTREEIMSMAAGPEMDRAVAELVMKCGPRYQWTPSTEINAAWEVVEKMQAKGLHVILDVDPAPERASGNECGCDIREPCSDWSETTIAQANANTAPLAICRAALLSVLAGKAAP